VFGAREGRVRGAKEYTAAVTSPAQTHRCFLMGEQSLLIHCAEALLERGHSVRGVIAKNDRIVGWARERGIAVLDPKSDLAAALAGSPFDLFLSVTNLSIVPAPVLALAQRAAINFHDGPLPRYAGLNVPVWALANRELTHGISWHRMTAGIDEGEVLAERTFSIRPRETSYSINTRCYEAAIESFGELLTKLESGDLSGRPQDAGERGYFARNHRPPAAGLLDWSRPAAELDALVRALDFGPTDNPVACAKVALTTRLDPRDSAARRAVFVATETAVHPATQAGAPGTVVALEPTLRVMTADGELEILGARTLDGESVSATELARSLGLQVGDHLDAGSADVREQLAKVDAAAFKAEAFWRPRLRSRAPVSLATDATAATAAPDATPLATLLELPAPRTGAATVERALTLVAGFLARCAGQPRFDFGYADAELRRAASGGEVLFAEHVPFGVTTDATTTFASLGEAVGRELTQLRTKGPVARDLAWRRRDVEGALPAHRVVVEIGQTTTGAHEATFRISPDGDRVELLLDRSAFDPATARSLASRFRAFAAAAEASPAELLAKLPLLSATERDQVLRGWNDTKIPFEHELCVHEAFARQAARTPDQTAVIFEDQTLTYSELELRTNKLARHLRSLGVRRDVRVGVSVERSLDMMIAILAVQKAGGAYVPMDPTYPADRIAFMLEDAQAPVLIARADATHTTTHSETKTVDLDAERATIDALSGAPLERSADSATPDSLAYVIYTSGSTGKPKGVMVEHRNVLNFFTGMDARIGHEPPGVWLAVTSLSFDISVLELFWTLSRGFTVVLYRDRALELAQGGRRTSGGGGRPLEFSLFYFASDEGEAVADKYQLLFEGARFADKNGFVAVWTPERHFHAFGGLYPNPSVASAALAMITERVQLRAGSCVLPLHPPTRVAEEWALVDNLSKGRVGIAFASGWQPNDFVIAPEKFQDRKAIMFRDIDVIRRLWRGESITLRSPLGKDVQVRTLPRPFQKELPIWITAAGNPETFEEAGKIGANVLTHLLGQTFEEVAQKNAIYRRAWKAAGHPGKGTITMMLHTFVGEDEEHVKATVRGPMKGYLKSAVNLVKQAAWTFPTFKQRADERGMTPADVFEKEELSAEDLDALLDHAFERYFRTSGLFGTPAQCAEVIDQLRAIDVDEVGCLMDYGVPSEIVMRHMPLLAEVKRLANASASSGAQDQSLAAQLRRHGVTHLQCTPSMLSMILGDPDARDALANLRCVMIGGEAFPLALAENLRRETSAKILNMYGPTETTIWSSVDVVEPSEGKITIGRPIANTQLYVLDANREPVPPGVHGELYIGGAGVVRGYLHRPELTAERFVADPFSAEPGARMYRTGDLARFAEDGRVDFLGRLDHQVKIRGYRIELGEIESALLEHPSVREAVVVALEDGASKRLVGYVSKKPGLDLCTTNLRGSLRDRLPEYMVPSQIVLLAALPLTPNAKIDRKALPAPESVSAAAPASFVAPGSEFEQLIAHVWSDLLHVERVGLDDNFFDLGGHSLLAVQAHRRIRDEAKRELSLTDLFRFPTIRGLAGFLEGDGGGGADLEKSALRAEARRESLDRRSELRARRRSQKES
jgi:natural product biosynthesis luciferase-like monooxygenase protein